MMNTSFSSGITISIEWRKSTSRKSEDAQPACSSNWANIEAADFVCLVACGKTDCPAS